MVRLATACLIGLLLGPSAGEAAPQVPCKTLDSSTQSTLLADVGDSRWVYSLESLDPAWSLGRDHSHRFTVFICHRCIDDPAATGAVAYFDQIDSPAEERDDRTALGDLIGSYIDWNNRVLWGPTATRFEGPPDPVRIGPLAGHLFRYVVTRELNSPNELFEVLPPNHRRFIETRTDLADATAAAVSDGCARLLIAVIRFRFQPPPSITPEELLAKLSVTRTPG